MKLGELESGHQVEVSMFSSVLAALRLGGVAVGVQHGNEESLADAVLHHLRRVVEANQSSHAILFDACRRGEVLGGLEVAELLELEQTRGGFESIDVLALKILDQREDRLLLVR